MNVVQKAAGWISDVFGGVGGSSISIWGAPSYSGKVVTPANAMQVSAVWACLKILGEGVGTLPLKTYKRLPNDGKAESPDHPLYNLLHFEPNPEMGAADFFISQTASLALWGNCYSKVVRDSSGKPIALWPLPSQLVTPSRDSGSLTYKYARPQGGTEEYKQNEVLHVRTMSIDGVNGISPITQVRNAIGLAMALEEYASRFFSNGGIPGLAIKHPGLIGVEAIKNLRESWKTLYGGVENSHEVAVLEEGMAVEVLGAKPAESQSIESRRFQLNEIARIYRVPPHMLADLERATFSNIEQQSLDFVIWTLRPWLVLWEQAIHRTLFSPADKSKYFARFDFEDLLRGDIASQSAAFAIGRQWGWYSINDVRKKLDENPIEGGDDHLTPMNMTPAGVHPDLIQPPKPATSPAVKVPSKPAR